MDECKPLAGGSDHGDRGIERSDQGREGEDRGRGLDSSTFQLNLNIF